MHIPRRRNLFIPLAVLATLALVASGCGSSDDDKDTDSSSTEAATTTQAATADAGTVDVEASEMKFVLSSPSAPAGEVTFNGKNVGTVTHEMVVIKTDTPAGDLPVKDGEVDEAGSIGEIGPDEFGPGKSATLALKMKAGHYALVCALPGHYQAGMYADFEAE